MLRDILTGLRNPTWQPFALVNLPVAALVTRPPAKVVFANWQALRLYEAGPEGLEGLAMQDLTAAPSCQVLREPCREMLRPGGATTEIYGIEEPYFALRRNGSPFRAVVKAERIDTPEGPFAALIVKEFMKGGFQEFATR